MAEKGSEGEKTIHRGVLYIKRRACLIRDVSQNSKFTKLRPTAAFGQKVEDELLAKAVPDLDLYFERPHPTATCRPRTDSM